MSNPFIGEIAMFGFNFAPSGWAFCNGQLVPIQQNQALFALLGTTYGGNGTSTFALPNLQSRVPIHQGTGNGLSTYQMGQMAGVEQTTVTANQLPAHTHPLSQAHAKVVIGARTAAASSTVPNGGFLGGSNTYVPGQTATNASLNSAMVAFGSGAATDSTGSNVPLPLPNLQPFQCVNFCIALQGIFPSRN